MLKSSFAGKNMKALALAAGAFALASNGIAADLSLPVTGNLVGAVLDPSGTPQMGATVQLFNKYQRPIAKTLTALNGRFAFANLPGDLYAIRVSLPSFLPASRDRIAVRAGLDSILQIHLATLVSSIEVSYAVPTAAMMDDWKWVLRSSPATRPITRMLPEEVSSSTSQRLHPRVFSGTHAMFSVSGGDAALADIDSSGGDLGTGFALSTNVFGKNQVQVGGTFGPNPAFGSGAMSLAAVYTRDQNGGFGEPPELTFTVSEFGVATGQSPAAPVGPGSAISVRAMSLSIYEVADPTSAVHLEYGVTGESVDYVQHTSRVSPFARSTVDLGNMGQVIAAYSDGARPDELTAHQQTRPVTEDGSGDDLVTAVDALARLPQLSFREGRLELQRTQDYELGYRKNAGSRTYAVSAFYEDASNGWVHVAGDLSALDPDDLFAEGISKTSAYNIGHYTRHGALASVNQRIGDSLSVDVAYGRMGGFTTGADSAFISTEPQQRFLDQGDQNFATVNLDARAPVAGTRISANYGWVDHNAIIPQHIFTTQDAYARPGLNIFIRQPLPSFFGVPGHVELTADVRNLLAQGYLPIDTVDGHRVLVMQAARAIRGGVNFVF